MMAAAQQSGLDSAPSASGDAFADAHADMLSDRTLQFEMEKFEPPDPPEWLEPMAEFLSTIAPVMVYIFWGGVIIIVLALLYFIGAEILRRLPNRRRDEAAEPQPVPQYRPAAAHARALLEEADRLAAEGKYGEAARVLLHRSIEDLERVFALAIGPGLTSREIAQLPPLSTEGRSVFARIARAVELSLFGGRALSADDFRQCREAYASFALSGARR